MSQVEFRGRGYTAGLENDPKWRELLGATFKIFKTEKAIEIHLVPDLVRLTDVFDKVLSEKYAYKSVKIALLLSNVIDADHQNSCLFTNKGHFSLPLWVLSGVLAKFHEVILYQ